MLGFCYILSLWMWFVYVQIREKEVKIRAENGNKIGTCCLHDTIGHSAQNIFKKCFLLLLSPMPQSGSTLDKDGMPL